MQRLRVVQPQVLLVLHLQPRLLELLDQPADTGQLAVREDVAADEAAARDRLAVVVRAGDAVVEKSRTWVELAGQEGRVRRELRDADVLGETDGADRVEARLGDVA